MKKCALALRDGDEEPMANRIHDIGIARQIGTYSDAVEAPANARWLITAGTPGLDAEGKVPSDFGAQAELAWSHIVTMLKRADMSVHDLVKVTQYLVHSSDIAAYAEVRARPSRQRAAGLATADRPRTGAARVPIGDRGLRCESVTP